MKSKRSIREDWAGGQRTRARNTCVKSQEVWAACAQHITPLASGPGAKSKLALHTQDIGEAGPALAITEVTVWKEEVGAATLHPTG